MEFPADMNVNQEPFFHVTAKNGSADLHIQLLRFYAKEAGVDHVILNTKDIGIEGPVMAEKLIAAHIHDLKHVLVIDESEDVTDVKLRED